MEDSTKTDKIDQNAKIQIDPEDTVRMEPEILVYGDGSIEALREPKKGTITWKINFRDGQKKEFTSPIRTTEWGSIKGPDEYDLPNQTKFDSQELAHETDSEYSDKELGSKSTKSQGKVIDLDAFRKK
jgi:hypothetical protein